jgi:hypothetical protein
MDNPRHFAKISLGTQEKILVIIALLILQGLYYYPVPVNPEVNIIRIYARKLYLGNYNTVPLVKVDSRCRGHAFDNRGSKEIVENGRKLLKKIVHILIPEGKRIPPVPVLGILSIRPHDSKHLHF